MLTRNLHQLETVVAEKGFDWDELRAKLRDEGTRPVIKHREFYSLDAAKLARIDDETYHPGQSSRRISPHFANSSASQPGLERDLASFEMSS
jgi:IS5 family transposase